MTLSLPVGILFWSVLGRSTLHGKLGLVTSKGVSHINVNSGKMYATFDWSAPASRKITTCLPAPRMVPRVGQLRVSLGVVVKEGTKARLASPASLKFWSQMLISIPSEFVKSNVTTKNQ
jgi:hypothetical protein